MSRGHGGEHQYRGDADHLQAQLAAGLALLLLLWDWNWFKRPIEYVVHARTGRVLHLDGNLDVDLGRMTRVTVDRLRFGNATWAKEKDMAKADRLDARVGRRYRDTVLAHCQGKLARFKIPTDIAIVPALPRNATGKVLKRELRKQFVGSNAPAIT